MVQKVKYLIFLMVCVILFAQCASKAAEFISYNDLIGRPTHYRVKNEETLYTIARRFDLGIVEVLAANPGTDPWLPKPGTKLTLPTTHVLPSVPRSGIVINLSELRLFYFMDTHRVLTFPVGIGKEGWQTPVGKTKITLKRKEPVWIPPASIRQEDPSLPDIVPAGPDNPMGSHALNLGWKGFVIHGTNRPYGVGKRSSHGCIRLYPEDMEILFNLVNEGTPVTIIDTPYKLGWHQNRLYMEVTPTQLQTDVIARHKKPESYSFPDAYKDIQKAARGRRIDWYAVDKALFQQNGLPVVISK